MAGVGAVGGPVAESGLPAAIDPYGVYTDLARSVYGLSAQGRHADALVLAEPASSVTTSRP